MEMIDFKDFAKVEIRVGLVVAAEVPQGSEKVIKMTVDFGEEKRTIFSGIKKWFEPEQMVGKKLPFILNIPPKKMGEMGESQGMLMAVITKDEAGEERPVLLEPTGEIKPGDQVL